MKNKPASLLVVPLEKALGGNFPSWSGRQMAAMVARIAAPSLLAKKDNRNHG